ncbi:hypothetical protein Vretimale_13127 [Volvox reticuliferus]|nr:hypothetical protein Vretifemale_15870 [Volvox reticuliferus]GIM09252.1 hypothetical protein Vretimale_13127 [Volvox reticuliferus]
MDVIRPRTVVDDSACGSLYDTVHAYPSAHGAKSSRGRVMLAPAAIGMFVKQEKSVTMQPAGFVLLAPSSQTASPGYEHLQDCGRALVPVTAGSPAISPARGPTYVAFNANSRRSGDYGLLNNTAAATAVASPVLTSTDASLMVDLAAANGSSGSFPGLVSVFGDRVSSRGPGNSSRQLSPVLSAGNPLSTATNTAVCSSATYGMEAAPNANPNVTYSRRHSVDAIKRQTSTSSSPAVAGAAGSATTGNPNAFDRWHPATDGTQPSGAARDLLSPRIGVDSARWRIGPGGLEFPIRAPGLVSAAPGTASAAEQCNVGGMSGCGSGGVDIGHMLARASELVAVAGNGADGGDSLAGAGGDAAPPPSPSYPSGSALARQQLQDNASPKLSSPNVRLQDGTFGSAGAGVGAAAGSVAIAAVASAAGIPPPGDATILAQGPVGAAGTAGVTYLLSTSDYHQPYHHPHPHHHLQAMPYGISQPVHVTRLDPVEEGCGSSAALSMGASSASVAVSSIQNIFTFAGPVAPSAATGGAATTTADAPAQPEAPTVSEAPTVQALSTGESRHSADHRQLSLTAGSKSPMAAAAAAGISLSNSGGGYRRRPSVSSTSASSRASLAATQQHAGPAGALADPCIVTNPGGGIDAVTGGSQTLMKSKSIKRSLSSMLRKVKGALRPGGGAGGGGGESRSG